MNNQQPFIIPMLLPNAGVVAKDMNPAEAKLYVALLYYTGKNNYLVATYEDISLMTSMETEKIKLALAGLEEIGVIETEIITDEGTGFPKLKISFFIVNHG